MPPCKQLMRACCMNILVFYTTGLANVTPNYFFNTKFNILYPMSTSGSLISLTGWNNFSSEIFLPLLKLFQSWNIIPCLSVKSGIVAFQLFHAASRRLFKGWNNIPRSFQRMEVQARRV